MSQEARLPVRRLIGPMLFVAALAACGPPEVILPGERYAPRDVNLAAEEYKEKAAAGTLQTVEPPPPPTRVPIATYSVSGAPQPISLGAARTNSAWTDVNGSPQHRIDQPALGASLTPIWVAAIGDAATRRVRLMPDPVASGGVIYTMSAFSQVTATSAGGGTVWQRDLTPATEKAGEASNGGLAYADGRLYVTTGYGTLFVLDPRTGATIWKNKLSSVPNSAPTVEGDFVYLTTRDNQAWAIDRRTGRVLWQIETGDSAAVVIDGAAPAIAGRAVLFPFGTGDLIAALRLGGVRLWSTSLNGERLGRAYAPVGDISVDPVVEGNRVYVGTPSGRLAALDATTGERIWTARHGGNSAVWPAGGSIFMLDDQAKLVRLDADTGETIWNATLPLYTTERVRARKGIVAHYGPILAGGRLILASTDGQLREIDPVSGKLLRSTPIGAPAAANPIVVDRVLYVVTDDGKLRAFR